MRRIQEESAALKALLSSASLIVLHFCTFVRLVTADHATCRRSKYSMVSGEMARSTAHQSTFYAALGFRRRSCCQDKENGGASNERFHFSLQS
jgi:hypothetical protein